MDDGGKGEYSSTGEGSRKGWQKGKNAAKKKGKKSKTKKGKRLMGVCKTRCVSLGRKKVMRMHLDALWVGHSISRSRETGQREGGAVM